MKDEALRLKAEGMSVRQISVRLGVPRATVGDWVKSRRACPGCGAEMGGHGHRHDKCQRCEREYRRWRHELILDVLEGCWLDGWPMRDMATVLGRADDPQSRAISPELDELRRRGRAPYRYDQSRVQRARDARWSSTRAAA